MIIGAKAMSPKTVSFQAKHSVDPESRWTASILLFNFILKLDPGSSPG